MLSQSASRSNRRFSAVKKQLVGRLDRAAGGNADFWDFRNNVEDLASKKLFQYPAMMVPAMQKQVISILLHDRPDTQTILDPFLGSGTILVLAMLNGRCFVGQDINPLSILIAKTKAFSLNYPLISEAVDQVMCEARKSKSMELAVRFVGQSKWFTDAASIGLSRLRNSIRKQPDQDVRRFLWVCLAETIRRHSNSRTSTFKLHVKPEEKRDATITTILNAFDTIAIRNMGLVKEFVNVLSRKGLVDENYRYKKSIKIVYGDSALSIPNVDWAEDGKCDLAVTSPPYGDNRTTVPYGQAAWLPLKWIDFRDIDTMIPKNAAERAYDVDNRSLGGDRCRHSYVERMRTLEAIGPITKAYINLISAVSSDGASRFIHFAFDVKKVLTNLAGVCRTHAKLVMTLGHRNIAQTICPLSDVCTETLSQLGIKEVVRIDRQIPSKRMPVKNSHSSTINREYISIYYKG